MRHPRNYREGLPNSLERQNCSAARRARWLSAAMTIVAWNVSTHLSLFGAACTTDGECYGPLRCEKHHAGNYTCACQWSWQLEPTSDVGCRMAPGSAVALVCSLVNLVSYLLPGFASLALLCRMGHSRSITNHPQGRSRITFAHSSLACVVVGTVLHAASISLSVATHTQTHSYALLEKSRVSFIEQSLFSLGSLFIVATFLQVGLTWVEICLATKRLQKLHGDLSSTRRFLILYLLSYLACSCVATVLMFAGHGGGDDLTGGGQSSKMAYNGLLVLQGLTALGVGPITLAPLNQPRSATPF